MFEACVDLPCELTAVALARHFVGQAVQAWEVDAQWLDDAVLLTSELVANGVLHARTDLRVTIQGRDDGSLRVAVDDDNSRVPTPAAPPDDATSGRGLRVIEAVADRWGVDRTENGKSVWFEVGPFRSDDDAGCIDLTGEASVEEALRRIEDLAAPPDAAMA
jgi:anti-sigma regulatory factor (Ser/Thr protein kinase)